MTYYVTVHKDEDQAALIGEPLDALNSHMVYDSGYSIADMVNAAQPWKVIWEMERDETAKFGYRFKRIVEA